MCASEKQRDYWLGMLSSVEAHHRPIPTATTDWLRRLIDTASFGISAASTVALAQPVVKGVLPGIGADARVVIWGEGVYNWFDPLSLIRAWPQVLELEPRARLLFMGMRHPNPDVPEMEMAVRAVRLRRGNSVCATKSVRATLEWIPYGARQEFLGWRPTWGEHSLRPRGDLVWLRTRITGLHLGGPTGGGH